MRRLPLNRRRALMPNARTLVTAAVVTAVAAAVANASCALVDSSTSTAFANLGASTNGLTGTGLALQVDYLTDTGTGQMLFEVREIPCPTTGGAVASLATAPVASATQDLADATLGAHPDNLFAPAAGHLFSDHFFTLTAGCYHITVQPLDAQGGSGTTCAPAYAEAEVFDGQTTEVLLISQCEGAAVGALDVLGALNHPPVINALIPEPSKFVFECEWADFCVDVSDPDGDPLEVELVSLDLAGAPVLLVEALPPGGGQVCLPYTAQPLGAHALAVRVYDLLDLDGDGQADQRVEDYLSQNVVPAQPSHDDLAFPLYVHEQILCDDGGTPRLLDRGLFVRSCTPQPPLTPAVLPPCPPLPPPLGVCCDTAGGCFELLHGDCNDGAGEVFSTELSCDPNPCVAEQTYQECFDEFMNGAGGGFAICDPIGEADYYAFCCPDENPASPECDLPFCTFCGSCGP